MLKEFFQSIIGDLIKNKIILSLIGVISLLIVLSFSFPNERQRFIDIFLKQTDQEVEKLKNDLKEAKETHNKEIENYKNQLTNLNKEKEVLIEERKKIMVVLNGINIKLKEIDKRLDDNFRPPVIPKDIEDASNILTQMGYRNYLKRCP